MKDFRIEDIIKYFISGIWIFLLLVQRNALPPIINCNQEFVVIITSLSIGVVVYFIFRTSGYPWLQIFLDWSFCLILIAKRTCRKKLLKKRFGIISENNGRNYIKKRFGIKKWSTRNDLWVLFHHKHKGELLSDYSIWLSSFITMYILSISTFVDIIYCLYCGQHYLISPWICIIVFIAGLISHINYESRDFINTTMITNPTLAEFVEEYIEKIGAYKSPNF